MPTEFLHGLYDGGIGAGSARLLERDGQEPDGGRRLPLGRGPTKASCAPTRTAASTPPATRRRTASSARTARRKAASSRSRRSGRRSRWRCPLTVRRAPAHTGTERSPSPTATTSPASNGAASSGSLLRFASPDAGGPARTVLAQGIVRGPAVAARSAGTLSLGLPSTWRRADAVHLTARGPSGEALWTWSATVPRAGPQVSRSAASPARSAR